MTMIMAIGIMLYGLTVEMPLNLIREGETFLKKIFKDLTLFACCEDDDEVNVFVPCDETIIPGLSCNICFVPICNIENMRENILLARPNSKRLQFPVVLTPGSLYNSFGAQVNTVSWESTVAGEKGANYLDSKITFKIPGATNALSFNDPGTVAAFCNMLNTNYQLIIEDCNGNRWIFGTQKAGLCISEGGIKIDSEANEIAITFNGRVKFFEYVFAIPKAA